jgi:hypothetical protein
LIAAEGLQRLAELTVGAASAQGLVLHLVGAEFEGYAPVPLDANAWYVGEDGYFQQSPVIFVMHKKQDVEVKGFELRWADGTLFANEEFEKTYVLYFAEQELHITPRYKLVELIAKAASDD